MIELWEGRTGKDSEGSSFTPEYLERLGENHENSYITVHVLGEIRTGKLPNKSLRGYRCVNPVGEINLNNILKI
jgi:hypothetical protein